MNEPEPFLAYLLRHGEPMATNALFDAWFAEQSAKPGVARRVEFDSRDADGEAVVTVWFYAK